MRLKMNSEYYKWTLFAKRIRALVSTSNFYFNSLRSNSSDPFGTAKAIVSEVNKVLNDLKEYKTTLNISSLISEFVTECEKYLSDLGSTGSQQSLSTLIVRLSLFETQTNYLLSDSEAYIRKTVEIALAHLQRMLIVDKSLQTSWKNAQKETEYEKLGGAHLLLHKIWAFKVDAAGERTDLVLSQPATDQNLLNSVEGLVLTEWKVVRRNMSDLNLFVQNAKKQIDKYSQGSLGAIELSKTRYLIFVSENYLNSLRFYRMILAIVNIAVLQPTSKQ